VFEADGGIAYIIHQLNDVTEPIRLGILRDEWTALVAHDLLQPLNTISGYAQLAAIAARGTTAAAPLDKHIGHIRKATALLARMVGDLMDGSRLESRRMTLDCSAVSIVNVVQETVDHLPDVAARCEVHVEYDANVQVWADAGRIEQVLGNLLTNATKYGEKGTPICIYLARDGSELRVTVENQGDGIPPSHIARIFDRFDRGCKTHKSGGVTGLGLGLHIAKGLVEAQGGRIWAESTPGAKTRFKFTLPLAQTLRDRARVGSNDVGATAVSWAH